MGGGFAEILLAGLLRLPVLLCALMNYVFYLQRTAGTLDASAAPFIFTLNSNLEFPTVSSPSPFGGSHHKEF